MQRNIVIFTLGAIALAGLSSCSPNSSTSSTPVGTKILEQSGFASITQATETKSK
jgi:hypothetical protein